MVENKSGSSNVIISHGSTYLDAESESGTVFGALFASEVARDCRRSNGVDGGF